MYGRRDLSRGPRSEIVRSDQGGASAHLTFLEQTVNTQFQSLDSKIMSVGRTAVRIGQSGLSQLPPKLGPDSLDCSIHAGDQLESIDRLRQRGSEAHDLILYYNEFAAGDTSRLEEMRKEGGREGRRKVAVAARRLLSLSKEVDGVEGADKVRFPPSRQNSPGGTSIGAASS